MGFISPTLVSPHGSLELVEVAGVETIRILECNAFDYLILVSLGSLPRLCEFLEILHQLLSTF